jgi:hypothetical protein
LDRYEGLFYVCTVSARVDSAPHVAERLCRKEIARCTAEYIDYYYWKEK